VTRSIKGIILIVSLCAVISLPGCTRQDWVDLKDIMVMWGQAHGLVNESGRPDYLGILPRVLGGSTGDPQADAVVDAGTVVDKFQRAEELSDKGRRGGSPEPVRQAITLRPGEFRYRNQLGAMMVAQGNDKEARASFAAADKAAAKFGKTARESNLNSRSTALSDEEVRLTGGTYWSGKPIDPAKVPALKRVFTAQAETMRLSFALTKSTSDEANANLYAKWAAELR
jgi:hypothetical protein